MSGYKIFSDSKDLVVIFHASFLRRLLRACALAQRENKPRNRKMWYPGRHGNFK